MPHPHGNTIDIDVGKLSIENLRSAPYKATVDFYEIAYSPAEHVEIKRKLYIAHFVFLFRDSVPNDLTQTNPLGIAITMATEPVDIPPWNAEGLPAV